MPKKTSIAVGVPVLLLSVFLFDTIRDAGAFRDIKPHFDGTCSVVEGVVGAEDITIDQSSGFAYISAHDRRLWQQDRTVGGAIYLYRPSSLSAPLAMPHNMKGELFPHGISLWKNPDGPDRLFVINHPVALSDGQVRISSQVVIFDIIGGTLKHVRTLETRQPYSLNDVAAVDADSFYASIDRGSLTPLGRALESYGRLRRGGIAYGDATGIRKAVSGLIYPNGVQLSADGRTLYVAETTGERLLAYARDPETGALTLERETEIDSGLDNLEWDANGNLWVGAHPRAIDFPAHSGDAEARSPSQILKVGAVDGDLVVDEIYLNDGNPLSGSSVGALYKDRLLIGSVFEPFILDCKRQHSGFGGR